MESNSASRLFSLSGSNVNAWAEKAGRTANMRTISAVRRDLRGDASRGDLKPIVLERIEAGRRRHGAVSLDSQANRLVPLVLFCRLGGDLFHVFPGIGVLLDPVFYGGPVSEVA